MKYARYWAFLSGANTAVALAAFAQGRWILGLAMSGLAILAGAFSFPPKDAP